MKGKLDLNGLLKIYRGDANPDQYQHQYCPFANMSLPTDNGLKYPTPCGTWCLHFVFGNNVFPGDLRLKSVTAKH